MSGGAIIRRSGDENGARPATGGRAALDGARTAARRALARPTPRAVVVGTWALLAAVAAAQVASARLLPTTHGAADAMRLRGDLALLALWALATPAIVALTRRHPADGGRDWAHDVAVHLAAATTFVVAANVAIRLPLLGPPWSLGAADVARDTLRGLARFGPAALVVYAAVAAAARHAWRATASRPATRDGGGEEALTPAPAAASSPPERVVVREWNRVHLVRPDDIEWVEADDNYVVVHVVGPAGVARTYKGRGRIGDLAAQLDPSRFVRIHRSAVVRAECVRELQPLGKGDLAVILYGGKTLRAARGRRAALEAALGVRR